MTRIIALAGGWLLTAAAWAQSDVDPNHRFAWGEQTGWINWQHNRPAAGDGVQIHATFLSGYAWSESSGWINLGNGSPANGVSYANASSADFGVNLDDDTGLLSGFAWGEHIGWINFAGGAAATPASAARIDFASCRLRGYAWGENAGWINLDHAVDYVGLAAGVCNATCPGDFDGDGDVDLADLGVVLSAFGLNGNGDTDGDGDTDLADLGVVLSAYGMPCP